MPTSARPLDDCAPVRIDAVPVAMVGDLLVFSRGRARFAVPRDLVCDCSDSFGRGSAGWLALPAWYVRSLGVDDAVWA